MLRPAPSKDDYTKAWVALRDAVTKVNSVRLDRAENAGRTLEEADAIRIETHQARPGLLIPAVVGLISQATRVVAFDEERARENLGYDTVVALGESLRALFDAVHQASQVNEDKWRELFEAYATANARFTKPEVLRLLTLEPGTEELRTAYLELQADLRRLKDQAQVTLSTSESEIASVVRRTQALLADSQRGANERFFVSRARAARRRLSTWLGVSLCFVALVAAAYSYILVGDQTAWRLILPLTISISLAGGVCVYQIVSATRLADQYDYKAALAQHLRSAALLGKDDGADLLRHFPLLAASEINSKGGASEAVPLLNALHNLGEGQE